MKRLLLHRLYVKAIQLPQCVLQNGPKIALHAFNRHLQLRDLPASLFDQSFFLRLQISNHSFELSLFIFLIFQGSLLFQ